MDLPTSERRPGDDAAILAAMAVLHFYHQNATQSMSRASAILHCVLSSSKHNYDALSLQIRLYSLLGCAAPATKCYSQLCIKNMQNATLSWLLYPGLSTLHPHPFPRPPSNEAMAMDPLSNLKIALSWHHGAENINQDSIVDMLEHGQYNMALDALDLRDSLGQGYSKIIVWCELRRLQRLRNALWEKDFTDTLSSSL